MEHIPFMKYQHILPSVEVDKGSLRIVQEKEPSTAGTDNFRDIKWNSFRYIISLFAKNHIYINLRYIKRNSFHSVKHFLIHSFLHFKEKKIKEK